MISKAFLALLVVPGVLLVAYQSKEEKPMTLTDFDRMYQQALKASLKIPGAMHVPCFVLQNERDYRYAQCFQDTSGSVAFTVKQMYEAFTKVGFIQTGPIGQGSNLDAGFVLKDSPYSVNITVGSFGISWQSYEDHRGAIAPRLGHDKDAPYALVDPIDAAREVALWIEVGTALKGKYRPDWLHPCGPATETEAAICIKADWTRSQAQKALVGRYFIGKMTWFTPLDKKETFEYREEPYVADSIKRKIADSSYTSDLLIKKLNQTTYLMRHKSDWPAYEFVFTIPAKGEKGDFKVLARRIAAPPYKV